MIKRYIIISAIVVSCLMMASPTLAQPTVNMSGSRDSNMGGQMHNQNMQLHDQTMPSNGVAKQRTQSDPTNTYLFKPGSGGYAQRPAQKQKTDGEDVTGNNNFPEASK